MRLVVPVHGLKLCQVCHLAEDVVYFLGQSNNATPQVTLAVASGQVFGLQGRLLGSGGSRSVRWADEEPATQSGFRIGASQQV